MGQSRRDFIAGSASVGLVGATSISSQAARAASSLPKVAVVHSTAFGGQNLENFLAGLRDQGWEGAGPRRTVDIKAHDAKGEYGRDDSDNPVRKIRDLGRIAVSDPPALVVAAGGLVAAIETARALEGSNIPFVFLVGRMPELGDGDNSTDEAFLADSFAMSNSPPIGGVNLNSIEQNQQRIDKLKAESQGIVTDANVCLVYNANAQMSGREVQAWQKNVNRPVVPLFWKRGSRKHDYLRLLRQLNEGFGALNPAPRGVVVSSDPFLRYFKGRFDTALRAKNGGNFNEWVCYPFQEYLKDPPQSKAFFAGAQLASLSGTDPQAAYFKLGVKAGQALTNRTQGNPLTKVGIETY